MHIDWAGGICLGSEWLGAERDETGLCWLRWQWPQLANPIERVHSRAPRENPRPRNTTTQSNSSEAESSRVQNFSCGGAATVWMPPVVVGIREYAKGPLNPTGVGA
ncbi:hypothetical protein F1880_003984 [Penicillium rolfsii]|nr:hypothetical protein F1880_003984 [Penicillium rolfsii]